MDGFDSKEIGETAILKDTKCDWELDRRNQVRYRLQRGDCGSEFAALLKTVTISGVGAVAEGGGEQRFQSDEEA
jgi:hypothetical protein